MGWFKRTPKPAPAPTPAPAPAPTPAPAPVAEIPSYIYGVATEQFTDVPTFNSNAGKPVNVYSIYQSFFWDKSFPTDLCNKISAGGATPMITWEPWEPNGNAVQPLYSLSAINSGKYDSYINNWANQIRAWNKPLLLRFAHEMNGDWYPWGSNVNGNTPEGYRTAYKRVIDLFRIAGVTNVKWVWSPNVDFELGAYYPGDPYVDYVALDGYNWDTSSPEQVFGHTIDGIKALTSRPLFIGETGCPEYSGKAKWISDFFSLLKSRSLVGFIWFNFKKEQDWRIESSSASVNSFKAGTSNL